MSRYFSPISEAFFRSKVESIFPSVDDYGEDLTENGTKTIEEYMVHVLGHMPSKVIKDLSKVKFDLENFGCSDEDDFLNASDILGFKVLSNGMPYLGCNAGGDWEHPLYFIIYWDGTSLRGYIPKDGNTYNTKYNTAFGSEEENGANESTCVSDIDLDVDVDKITRDIIARIILKQ